MAKACSCALQVPDAIRTSQVADSHARFLRCTGGTQRIRSDIDVDDAFNAEERAFLIGRNRQVIGVVMGMDRGEQMFTSVLNPLGGRASEQAPRPRDHNAIFATEAATHVGSNDRTSFSGRPGIRDNVGVSSARLARRQIDDRLVQPIGLRTNATSCRPGT